MTHVTIERAKLEQVLEALLINCGGNTEGIGKDAIIAINQALAAPTVQGPVAWMCHPFGDAEVEYGPYQQCENCMPLYTTPPAAQRQWVGLTPREIYNLWEDSGVPFVDWDSFASITRAIESKLKEKNT